MSDMIELWDKTENKWSVISEMYMKQIDMLLVDFHLWIEENMEPNAETPGILVLYLKAIKSDNYNYTKKISKN